MRQDFSLAMLFCWEDGKLPREKRTRQQLRARDLPALTATDRSHDACNGRGTAWDALGRHRDAELAQMRDDCPIRRTSVKKQR
jgi:hypothetical protein